MIENEDDVKYIYIDERCSINEDASSESQRWAIKKICKILKDNEDYIYEQLKEQEKTN